MLNNLNALETTWVRLPFLISASVEYFALAIMVKIRIQETMGCCRHMPIIDIGNVRCLGRYHAPLKCSENLSKNGDDRKNIVFSILSYFLIFLYQAVVGDGLLRLLVSLSVSLGWIASSISAPERTSRLSIEPSNNESWKNEMWFLLKVNFRNQYFTVSVMEAPRGFISLDRAMLWSDWLSTFQWMHTSRQRDINRMMGCA